MQTSSSSILSEAEYEARLDVRVREMHLRPRREPLPSNGESEATVRVETSEALGFVFYLPRSAFVDENTPKPLFLGSANAFPTWLREVYARNIEARASLTRVSFRAVALAIRIGAQCVLDWPEDVHLVPLPCLLAAHWVARVFGLRHADEILQRVQYLRVRPLDEASQALLRVFLDTTKYTNPRATEILMEEIEMKTYVAVWAKQIRVFGRLINPSEWPETVVAKVEETVDLATE